LKILSEKTNIKITEIGSFTKFKNDHIKFIGFNQIPKAISYSHF
jgi:hypothetical protein